jgi:hypothetical protein
MGCLWTRGPFGIKVLPFGEVGDPQAVARQPGLDGPELVGRHPIELLLGRKPRVERANIVHCGEIAPGDEQPRSSTTSANGNPIFRMWRRLPQFLKQRDRRDRTRHF